MAEQSRSQSSATLLVTVGSTLFPSLTDLALSPPFLASLVQLGVQSLLVQYGRASLTLPPDIHPVEVSPGRRGAGELAFTYRGMRVHVLRYTDDFEGLVRDAAWVIGHAGESLIFRLNSPHCVQLCQPPLCSN
jgi:beta-1,4-N-acetylglucosaminyltransferase